jgi:hypothetical protein
VNLCRKKSALEVGGYDEDSRAKDDRTENAKLARLETEKSVWP